MSEHVGRAWSGSHLEDQCPCPKEPCGLVVLGRGHPDCTEHTGRKTIRQSHRAQDCPGPRPATEQARADLTAAAQRAARRAINERSR